MVSKRKFYKTVVRITVLSDDDRSWGDLSDIVYDITDGDCVGSVMEEVLHEEIDAKTAANLLIEFGSEPGFFQLDDDGNEVEP